MRIVSASLTGPLLRLLAAALAGLAALPSCAGYQIGNKSLYPAGIETVYVPICKSNSFRRGLGEQLTEAIQKEIEKKTPYKVVGTPNADSTLLCEISGEKKTVLARHLQRSTRVGDQDPGQGPVARPEPRADPQNESHPRAARRGHDQ